MAVATMRVPTIFTAVDRFSNVVDKMTRKTTMFGQAASAAAMRTSKRFNAAGTSLLSSGAIMGAGIGIAVNEAVKFEKAISNVSTLLDSTPASMKTMGDKVLNMSKKIPIPIDQMTLALYDVISAGIKASDSMTVLMASSRLAVGGLGTAQEGVDIMTSSLNAFNMSASQSESVANMVFKSVKYGKTTVTGLAESFGNSASLIKNSNIELSEFLATTAALTTTGMSAARAQVQVASATIALLKPNKSMSKIYSRLGVKDVPTFIKKSGGLVKTLKLVVDSAKKTGVTLPDAFGRKEGLNATISLLGSVNAKFNEVNNDMISGSDSLSNAVKKQTATTAARFQLLKNNLVDLAIKIGNAVLPALNSIMYKLSPIISGVTTWSQNNQWLARTLLYTTVVLLSLGVAAKIGAALFYGYSVALSVVNSVMSAYNFIATLAMLSNTSFAFSLGRVIGLLGATATSFLLTIAPIVAVGAALIGLIYLFNKSGNTVANFGRNNIIHLRTVSGEYESMESRIKASNDRIVASMKKFKLDLESVKATGKTVSELAQERTSKIFNYANTKQRTEGVGKASISTNVSMPKMFRTNTVSDSDTAYESIMGTKPENLAGRSKYATIGGEERIGGLIKVEISDPGKLVNDIKTELPKGIKVVTSSTKK